MPQRGGRPHSERNRTESLRASGRTRAQGRPSGGIVSLLEVSDLSVVFPGGRGTLPWQRLPNVRAVQGATSLFAQANRLAWWVSPARARPRLVEQSCVSSTRLKGRFGSGTSTSLALVAAPARVSQGGSGGVSGSSRFVESGDDGARHRRRTPSIEHGASGRSARRPERRVDGPRWARGASSRSVSL